MLDINELSPKEKLTELACKYQSKIEKKIVIQKQISYQKGGVSLRYSPYFLVRYLKYYIMCLIEAHW